MTEAECQLESPGLGEALHGPVVPYTPGTESGSHVGFVLGGDAVHTLLCLA
jgi:hypothetical protein